MIAKLQVAQTAMEKAMLGIKERLDYVMSKYSNQGETSRLSQPVWKRRGSGNGQATNVADQTIDGEEVFLTQCWSQDWSQKCVQASELVQEVGKDWMPNTEKDGVSWKRTLLSIG